MLAALMGWAAGPVSTSFAALISTAHLTIALLARQRLVEQGRALAALPGFLFVAVPWIVGSGAGLALGLAAQLSFLGALRRLVSPRTPKTAPAATAPAPPRVAGFVPTPVLAVLDETDDIRTFRLLRPDGFEFSAGQFLTVRVQLDGRPLVRCYSISSAPHVRGYLEISVKRQGVVSSLLHQTVRPGSLLAVGRPAGSFVYPEGDDRPLVLVGGGVGITPLLSMLRHALAAEPTRPIALLLSARTESDLPFSEDLRLLARRHPQLRVDFAVTRTTAPATSSDVHTGRIDSRLIARTVPDPAHSLFYLCGPGPMVEAIQEALSGLGVPRGHVRAEAFEAAVAATSLTPARYEPAPGRTPRAAASSRPSHDLKLTRSGKVAAVAAGQSLLEACEAAGVAMPSSCRAGVCQTCRTRLLSGPVDCQSDLLDPDDRAAGYVLPCVSFTSGDCALEA